MPRSPTYIPLRAVSEDPRATCEDSYNSPAVHSPPISADLVTLGRSGHRTAHLTFSFGSVTKRHVGFGTDNSSRRIGHRFLVFSDEREPLPQGRGSMYSEKA